VYLRRGAQVEELRYESLCRFIIDQTSVEIAIDWYTAAKQFAGIDRMSPLSRLISD